MADTTIVRRATLIPDELSDYERQGFLVLRAVFNSTEVDELKAESEVLLKRRELMDPHNLRCRWQPHEVTGALLFETFDPVVDIAPACARVAADLRILDVLAMLYGEPPCLFKDKLIFKPPGARGYDLHQDYIAWPGFPRTFITVLVAIDPAAAANGCTEVFPGYHRRGYLSPPDGRHPVLPEGVCDEHTRVELDLSPGDIALFGCFTPHRSAANRSDGWRRQLYLSYNATSEGGQQRERHYRQYHDWLLRRYAEQGRTDVFFR